MDWDAHMTAKVAGVGLWMSDAAISVGRSRTRLDRVWYSLLDTTKDSWRGVRWHNFQMTPGNAVNHDDFLQLELRATATDGQIDRQTRCTECPYQLR